MEETRINLDVRPAPKAARRARRFRRWLPALVTVGVLVALTAGYAFYQWWISPEHRLQQFVAAAQRGDGRGMLALVDAEERERLGITPEVLPQLLRDAAGCPGRLLLRDLKMEGLNERQRRFNRLASVALYSSAGQPLPGMDGGAARAYVFAWRKRRGGWKIALSHFIWGITMSRRNTPGALPYANLCERYNLPRQMFEPVFGRWVTSVARRNS